jgi:hypothetical protein
MDTFRPDIATRFVRAPFGEDAEAFSVTERAKRRSALAEELGERAYADQLAEELVADVRRFGQGQQVTSGDCLRPYFYLENPTHRTMHEAFERRLNGHMRSETVGDVTEWHEAARLDGVVLIRRAQLLDDSGAPLDWSYQAHRIETLQP